MRRGPRLDGVKRLHESWVYCTNNASLTCPRQHRKRGKLGEDEGAAGPRSSGPHSQFPLGPRHWHPGTLLRTAGQASSAWRAHAEALSRLLLEWSALGGGHCSARTRRRDPQLRVRVHAGPRLLLHENPGNRRPDVFGKTRTNHVTRPSIPWRATWHGGGLGDTEG